MSTLKRTKEYFLNDQKVCTCCYHEWFEARKRGAAKPPQIRKAVHIHAVIPGSTDMRDWIAVCTPHKKKLRTHRAWARQHGYTREKRAPKVFTHFYRTTPYQRVVFLARNKTGIVKKAKK